MSRSPDHEFLQRVEAYLARTGLKEWAFGRFAANDPALVPQLRDGRELRRATRERVTAFMDANPDGIDLAAVESQKRDQQTPLTTDSNASNARSKKSSSASKTSTPSRAAE